MKIDQITADCYNNFLNKLLDNDYDDDNAHPHSNYSPRRIVHSVAGEKNKNKPKTEEANYEIPRKYNFRFVMTY